MSGPKWGDLPLLKLDGRPAPIPVVAPIEISPVRRTRGTYECELTFQVDPVAYRRFMSALCDSAPIDRRAQHPYPEHEHRDVSGVCVACRLWPCCGTAECFERCRSPEQCECWRCDHHP